MEEEEEVDIVGGYDVFISKSEREISNISSGQILSCDYTVHPRWLTDNNDGTELWPDNLPKQSSQDEMELVQDEVVIEEPAPIDFDWCEETSNCGDIILEQDIPATLEEEVITNSGTEDENYDEKCSQNSSQTTKERNLYVLDRGISSQESGFKPVVQSTNPRSLLKKIYVNEIERPPSKFRQTLTVNRSILKNSLSQKLSIEPPPPPPPITLPIVYESKRKKNVPLKTVALPPVRHESSVKQQTIKRVEKGGPKFRQTIKLTKTNNNEIFQSKKLRYLTKKLRERTQNHSRNSRKIETETSSGSKASNSGKIGNSSRGGGGKRGGKRFLDLNGENITINHDIESGTSLDPRKVAANNELEATMAGNGANLSDDSNSDIDIESEITPQLSTSTTIIANTIIKYTKTKANRKVEVPANIKETTVKMEALPPATNTILSFDDYNGEKGRIDSPELLSQLEDMQMPTEEKRINLQEITELEKYFHSEFFEGRPTKTPERYVKIRNFIVTSWHESKPTYISKTAVRNGLKHCGDVNCISRIHYLLEQIAAINFGYEGEHFVYIRPLFKLIDIFNQPMRNKASFAQGMLSMNTLLARRKRLKSQSYVTLPESVIDANFTVSHIDGTVVSKHITKVLDRDEYDVNSLRKKVNPELQLINCLKFNRTNNVAPFEVSITLSTLLCLQLHALSARNEVMGFLGGKYSSDRRKLSITRYKPCRTSTQSATMCEMCPVSQAEQSNSLLLAGLELLGWFHSHPTFPSNPSRTDVRTQADMQLQFSLERARPFVGLIINCIDMKYKCMYVLPSDLHEITDETLPYEIDVGIVKDCTQFKTDILDVFAVIDRGGPEYPILLEKFGKTANNLLQQYGYGTDILSYLKNVLY